MDRKQSLSSEEKEDLRDLVTHEGFRVLIRAMELELESIQDEVLKFDLGTGDERALVRLKSRAEGAAKLLFNVRAKLEGLKKKA
jgi:hypothetical protein